MSNLLQQNLSKLLEKISGKVILADEDFKKLEVLDSFSDGKSGSEVFLVDCDFPGVLFGEHILKITPHSNWSDYVPEETRYHNTNKLKPLFAKLIKSYKIDTFIFSFWEKAFGKFSLSKSAQLSSIQSQSNRVKATEKTSAILLSLLNLESSQIKDKSFASLASDVLGYRLSPEQGNIYNFARDTFEIRWRVPDFTWNSLSLPDPYYYSRCANNILLRRVFYSESHGDCHPGNIFAVGDNNQVEEICLIDAGLSSDNQLIFYDIAYFEISLIINSSLAQRPEHWLPFLTAVSSGFHTQSDGVVSDDVALIEQIEALRKPAQEFILANRTLEGALRQLFNLQQIFVGLNFSNKGISSAQRQLAFLYASFQLKQLLSSFQDDPTIQEIRTKTQASYTLHRDPDAPFHEDEIENVKKFENIWKTLEYSRDTGPTSSRRLDADEIFEICEDIKILLPYNRRPSYLTTVYTRTFPYFTFWSAFTKLDSAEKKVKLLGLLSIAIDAHLMTLSTSFDDEDLMLIKNEFEKLPLDSLSQDGREDWYRFGVTLVYDSVYHVNQDEFQKWQNLLNETFSRYPLTEHQLTTLEYSNKLTYAQILYQALSLDWIGLERSIENWFPEIDRAASPQWSIKKLFLLFSTHKTSLINLALNIMQLGLDKLKLHLERFPFAEQMHFFEAYSFYKGAYVFGDSEVDDFRKKYNKLKAMYFTFQSVIKDHLHEIDKPNSTNKLPEEQRDRISTDTIHFGPTKEVSDFLSGAKAIRLFLEAGITPNQNSTYFINQEDFEKCLLSTYTRMPYPSLFLGLAYAGVNYPDEKWPRKILRQFIFHPPYEDYCLELFEKFQSLWSFFDVSKDKLSQSILVYISELLLVVPYKVWKNIFLECWETFSSTPDRRKYLYYDIQYGASIFLEKALPLIQDTEILKNCLTDFLEVSSAEAIKINLLAALNDNQIYLDNPQSLLNEAVTEKINILIESIPSDSSLSVKALNNISELLTDEHRAKIVEQILTLDNLPVYKETLVTINRFLAGNKQAQNHLKELIKKRQPIWVTGIEKSDTGWTRHMMVSHLIPFRNLSKNKYNPNGIKWEKADIIPIFQDLLASVKEFKMSPWAENGLSGLGHVFLNEAKFLLDEHVDDLREFSEYEILKSEIDAVINIEGSKNLVLEGFRSNNEKSVVNALGAFRKELLNENYTQFIDSWQALLTKILVSLEPRLDNCIEFMVNWLVSLYDSELVQSGIFINFYINILAKYSSIHDQHPDPVFIQSQMIRLAQTLFFWKHSAPEIDYFLNLKRESNLIPIINMPELPKEIAEKEKKSSAEVNTQSEQVDGHNFHYLVSKINIANFKSIPSTTVDLGQINVFIGENGAGKSNVLEGIALAAAAFSKKLSTEFLNTRGIREVKPSLMKSAFTADKENENIVIEFLASLSGTPFNYAFRTEIDVIDKEIIGGKEKKTAPQWHASDIIGAHPSQIVASFTEQIGRFIIYSPDYVSLRTFKEEGQIRPLGINGEGLFDTLLRLSADQEKVNELNQWLTMFSWFESIRLPEHGLEREIEVTDVYLGQHVRHFNQYSSNEGFLFALFYLTLFLSSETPDFFAIDNVESSLNPKLCTHLIKSMATLSKKYRKQVILTTHNPAVLDGLNLSDETQKLFVVTRNMDGHTKIVPVTKPTVKEGSPPIKLSEAFMRGYLGGLPESF